MIAKNFVAVIDVPMKILNTEIETCKWLITYEFLLLVGKYEVITRTYSNLFLNEFYQLNYFHRNTKWIMFFLLCVIEILSLKIFHFIGNECVIILYFLSLLICYPSPLYGSLIMPSFQNFCDSLAALQTAIDDFGTT